MAVLNSEQLKELDELKVSAHGVVSKTGGFEGTYTSRILVIGLGGMGLKTTRRLKRELKDRIGGINGNYLRILSFDTDSRDRENAIKSNSMTAEEIPSILNGSISSALAAGPEFRPKAITAVIPDGFMQALDGTGANQVRLAGRLTLMDLSIFNTITESIETAIKNLQDFAESTLDVHVVAGIGGGSGSGMIIDIPYIVRAVVQKLGITESKLRLFGHVYLPNSYSGISNKAAANRNGYAALKEIDYYMNIEAINETYDAVYPDVNIGRDGCFSSHKNIFDQCTLIGGKIAAPIVIANPQETALAVCVEDLVNQCTSVKGQVDQTTGSITDFFTSNSFQTNSGTALSTVMSNANVNFPKYANYNYNIIGSTSIKFPTDAITEQLVGEMTVKADDMLKKNVNTLTQADVDQFEEGLFKPVAIIEARAKRLEAELDACLNDPERAWNKKNILDSTHRDPLESAVRNALANFDENNDFIERLKAEANTKAEAIFTDPAKGPYFLKALLTSETDVGGIQGFYQKIRGYNAATMAIKSACEKVFDQETSQIRERQEVMQKAFHFNNNLSAYKEDLKNLYLAKFKIALCERLFKTYYVDLNERRGVAYSLKYALDNAFLVNVDMFERINEIMIANLSEAKAKLDDSANNDPTSIFALQDPVFDTLKSTVRNTVSLKMTRLGDDAAKHYAAALTGAIMHNRDDWRVTENCEFGKSQCAKAFRNFIASYPPFADVVNKKMIDYFDEAYSKMGEGAIDNVIQKLLSVVRYYSAPMCNVWDSPYFNFEEVSPLKYAYLVLPNGFASNDNTWGAKFNAQFGVNRTTSNIYWSPDQDAIYCYTLYTKMPIWIHKDLIEYEEDYNSMTIAGVHTTENPKVIPPLKDYPSLMIKSQWYRARSGALEYEFAPETKMMNEVGELVKLAIRHGIIRKNGIGNYVVCTISDKPNPADGRSKERIDNFIKSFANDPTNKKDDGTLIIEKNLFAKICEKFTVEEQMIYGGRDGFAADTEEATVVLMRKQMKLLQKLREEIEYYTKNFLAPVDAGSKGIKEIQQQRTFAQYLLFGFIFEERNIWKYKLGDTSYEIVLKAEAPREYREYMEMAACKAIWKLDDIKAHKVRLDELLLDRTRRVARREDDSDPLYASVKAQYDALSARCRDIIDQVTDRYNNGNELTDEEKKRRAFYEVILDEIKAQMDSF